MKKFIKASLAAAMLAASSYAAADVNIGGLNVPTGAHFEVASIYENVITGLGQELKGVGEVTQINGFAISDLCSGCELTYRFSGYIVTSLSATEVRFSGGTIQFYLGFAGANDFNPFFPPGGSSAIDLAAATNGTLFLTLAGHAVDAMGNTFIGTGTAIGTAAPVGSGSGLGDVVLGGGIGSSNFDSNSIAAAFGTAFADFQINSSFGTAVVPHPGECTGTPPTGAECLAGSADLRGLVIPEPDSLALLGLGVVGLGLTLRRRKAAK